MLHKSSSKRGGRPLKAAHLEVVPLGAIEGDALGGGDRLASGLYGAMLKIRSHDDIPEKDFPQYAAYRPMALQEAEEIWKRRDAQGHIFVSFIKDCEDDSTAKNLHYIVITLEDEHTNSHPLLFSFPTTDPHLLERYRQGEAVQADEVIQESAH